MITKKAQMQQVFTYIMAILIIGTILILGLRAITNITDKACDVDEVTFKKNLENTISKNSNLGTLGYEAIKVPCNYGELYFIDKNVECDDIENDIVKGECNAKTENNVFIKQGDVTLPLFSIENLVVDQDGPIILQPQGGRYYMKLEGIGKRQVKISQDDR